MAWIDLIVPAARRLRGPLLLCALAAAAFFAGVSQARAQDERPNILWVSAEDLSPDLGAYGSAYADTPNIDQLAREGARYTRAFATTPVCAPARSAIITGMYSTSIGTHQMRCRGVPPPEVRCFTEYLRAAGYYCTNNVKTDYQFEPPPTAWDQSSNRAHWRSRAPGQPFFSVFNFTISHESQIRNYSPEMEQRLAALGDRRHDPARAVLPPYYPDTPVVRRDWARYHDIGTLMDQEVGEILRQLDEDGLAENTIVMFWGDHGRGLTRAKRWVYDSGTHVPLIVRTPERLRARAHPQPGKLAPGSVNGELVSFVDFAPTILALAGVPAPRHLQGRRFLGREVDPEPAYVYANRDRMDEAFDLIRSARDHRYRYIRNFMPHVPADQDIAYMNQMPTIQEMRRLYAAGELTGPQLQYFRQVKPVEELYDTQADPHEVDNLAARPEQQERLLRMRAALLDWMKRIGDIGLIPEAEFDELKRPGGIYAETAAPAADIVPVEGGHRVTLDSPTYGALVDYRIGTGPWKLYTAPIRLPAGQSLQARANRIGFTVSPLTRVIDGKAVVPDQPAATQGAPLHWRELVENSDLMERLHALEELDHRGAAALPELLKALDDPHPSVRWWAAVESAQLAAGPDQAVRARPLLELKLADPSPLVRVAAAHYLARWGGERRALAVLAEALTGPDEGVRLQAIIALNRLGEIARPLLPLIRAARQDPGEYVKRVSEDTVRKLEG